MKNITFILVLLTSNMALSQTISNTEFFNALDSLSTPKMCVLQALYNGVTILSCDGSVFRTELGEDYESKNLTQIGALLIKKGMSSKSCQIIRSVPLGSSEEKNIGNICFFGI